MKIDLATSKSILVELTREDLQRFGLTVEELDYSQQHTRRVLQSILRRICSQTGVCYRLRACSRIDVMADRSGGCLMIITDCEKTAQTKEEIEDATVYFTEDWNNLIDVSRAVCALDVGLPDSCVLKNDAGFFLLLMSGACLFNTLLCEFLDPVCLTGEGFLCLSEQLQPLIEHRALELLGGKLA